ncbi:polysaccharide biosynthesis protein [Clostridioides mangenotii]|uniref:polysaccharide biosynthesis protein n=1 Tax=Metaclostridioides mangenotii TaxID=1540 RepID=UPI001C1296DF|nr:polysaccharide biosynthesis protein [Clostridioides mangenotii]MBU5307593.1 polysaccharide biosynthesis protein [Clostridioides mangenotii]MCR1954335.1 polysaccharide biosynthesis protein [Clostridioides mangenotii]
MKIPYLVMSTAILFVSNFIVRIFGFIYKVFLSRALGETGLGIYHMIFNFLMICLSVTTTGIPTALSCLIANKKAIKDKHSSNVLFISTLYIAFFVSLIISLIVSFNSKFFSAKFLNNPHLNLFILAIAPAIVTITISNVLRGYYYGVKKVKIPAVGQIIEQITKILFVVLLVMYMGNKNFNCYIALLGVSIGELSNIIFMTVYLWRDSTLFKKYVVSAKDFYNSSLETIKMSIPITCNRMSSIFLQSISSMMVPSRLALSGMTYTKSLSMYGVISGMVMPFVFIPFTLGSALIVNLIPSISQGMALNKKDSVIKKIKYSILLTLAVGILSSIFFYFFGERVCVFVFKNELAGKYLKSMFLVPLFMSLNQTLSGILNAIRKELASSINTIVGMVIQIIALYTLLPIPSLNIYALIYVMTSVSMLTCILHSLVLLRSIKSLRSL